MDTSMAAGLSLMDLVYLELKCKMTADVWPFLHMHGVTMYVQCLVFKFNRHNLQIY